MQNICRVCSFNNKRGSGNFWKTVVIEFKLTFVYDQGLCNYRKVMKWRYVYIFLLMFLPHLFLGIVQFCQVYLNKHKATKV